MRRLVRASIALLLTGASSACSSQSLKAVEIELVIAHHEDVPADAKTVAAILATATDILQKQDIPGDTACPVRFVLKPKLIALDRRKLPYAISHKRHFATLATLPGDVKLVGRIKWCGTYSQHYWGCAAPFPGVMAMAPLDDPTTAGVVWAHEFGHCKGLGHSPADQPDRVMIDGIVSRNRLVSMPECEKLLTPSLCGGRQGPNSQTYSQLISRVALPQSVALPPVEEFVRRYWVHGVPYDVASRYDKESGRKLVTILGDRNQRQYWTNAVTTLGMIGDSDYAEPLIAFFKRGEGELDFAESHAKSAVPISLGMIVNKSSSKAAYQYLVELSRPRQGLVRWVLKGRRDSQLQARDVATSAAIGLAFSGSPNAEAELEAIGKSIERGAFSLDVGAGQPIDVVDDLRALNRQLRTRGGLDAYLRQPRPADL